MQKQRNAVEKSLLEVTEQLKTVLTQRLYGALAEAGITDRQKSIRVLAIVNAAIDETYNKFSRHFDKSIDDLVAAAQEAAAPRKSAKTPK